MAENGLATSSFHKAVDGLMCATMSCFLTVIVWVFVNSVHLQSTACDTVMVAVPAFIATNWLPSTFTMFGSLDVMVEGRPLLDLLKMDVITSST